METLTALDPYQVLWWRYLKLIRVKKRHSNGKIFQCSYILQVRLYHLNQILYFRIFNGFIQIFWNFVGGAGVIFFSSEDVCQLKRQRKSSKMIFRFPFSRKLVRIGSYIILHDFEALQSELFELKFLESVFRNSRWPLVNLPHQLRRNSNYHLLLGAVESVQPDTSEFDDMLIDAGVIGCPIFYRRG